jgi:hypothetical protein
MVDQEVNSFLRPYLEYEISAADVVYPSMQCID